MHCGHFGRDYRRFFVVWLQVLGLPLRSAVAWSFLVYGLELLLFFPPRIHTASNLLLAVGCVAEDLVLRRRAAAVGPS